MLFYVIAVISSYLVQFLFSFFLPPYLPNSLVVFSLTRVFPKYTPYTNATHLHYFMYIICHKHYALGSLFLYNALVLQCLPGFCAQSLCLHSSHTVVKTMARRFSNTFSNAHCLSLHKTLQTCTLAHCGVPTLDLHMHPIV